MAETTALFHGIDDPHIIRFSGNQFRTSLIRSSTSIVAATGSDNINGMSIDGSNYAIGNDIADEIWYMAGHYTSTVLNSVVQASLSGSIIDLSIDDEHTLVKGNFPGNVEMTLFSGKVTSVILDTFDPDTTGIYAGGATIRGLDLLKEGGVRKAIIFTTVDGTLTHLRISLAGNVFPSTFEDIEISPNSTLGFTPTRFHYNGTHITYTNNQSSPSPTTTQRAFFQQYTFHDDIIRPAFISAGGVDGSSSDSLAERLFSEVIVPDVDQSVSFSHIVSIPAVIQRATEHFIVFAQTVIGGNSHVRNEIDFEHTVSIASSIYNRSLTHEIGFSPDFVGLSVEKAVTNTVDFSQSVSLHHQENIGNTLTFSHVVVEDLQNANLVDNLLFTHSVNLVSTLLIVPVPITLTFSQIITHYLVGVSDCTYDPQPPRSLDFPISTRANVTLSDNLAVPVNIASFRNPRFGNIETIEIFRALNISRSRKRAIFRDNDWPKNRVLTINSDENTLAESITLLAFLSNTLGKIIKLTDWEDRVWVGIILNPDSAVKDLGNCRFQFAIEFMGTLIERQGVDYERTLSQNLFLSHSVSPEKICFAPHNPQQPSPPEEVDCMDPIINPGFPPG